MTAGGNFGARVPEAFETLQGAANERPPRQRGAWWAWLVIIIGATYFIVPLIATSSSRFDRNRRAAPTPM
jgi:hypothetical protein